MNCLSLCEKRDWVLLSTTTYPSARHLSRICSTRAAEVWGYSGSCVAPHCESNCANMGKKSTCIFCKPFPGQKLVHVQQIASFSLFASHRKKTGSILQVCLFIGPLITMCHDAFAREQPNQYLLISHLAEPPVHDSPQLHYVYGMLVHKKLLCDNDTQYASWITLFSSLSSVLLSC